MFWMLLMSKLIWVILSVMVVILNLTSKKTFSDREKSSPFECGFDPKSTARVSFSLHFFLIAVIFIIFDVELTLLLPTMMALKICNLFQFTMIMIFFILILLIGLYHEWKQGALEWTK